MALKQYAKKKKKENTVVTTIRIPEHIFNSFREYCGELEVTINEAINFLIKNELESEYKSETAREIGPKPQKIKEETKPADVYILRKTAKVGKPLKVYTTYNLGPFEWSVHPECCPHFDKDGKMIPIRNTFWDGTVIEPDIEELKELATILGKPVSVEK